MTPSEQRYSPQPRTWARTGRVLQLHAKGYSRRRIALYVGLSRGTVGRIIREMEPTQHEGTKYANARRLTRFQPDNARSSSS